MRVAKICQCCGGHYKAGLFDDPNLCRVCAALGDTFSAERRGQDVPSDGVHASNGLEIASQAQPSPFLGDGLTRETFTAGTRSKDGCPPEQSPLPAPVTEPQPVPTIPNPDYKVQGASLEMQAVHRRMDQRTRKRGRLGRWFFGQAVKE